MSKLPRPTLAVKPAQPAVFLRHEGEACALIHAFDWSATPLGPIGAWPQSLKTAVSLLVHSSVPIVMLWGADGIMIYNDAYSVFAGGRHPGLLGCKIRDGWPEAAEFSDHVMKVCLSGGTLEYRDQKLTLNRTGVAEQVWLNLNYSPVFDESGAPAGVIAIVAETTERVLNDRRRAFKAELADHLASLTNPHDLPMAAAQRLGTHLGANRVGFTELTPDGHVAMGDTCFAQGVAPAVGEFRTAAFGRMHAARQRQGKTVVVADVHADPDMDASAWDAWQIRAVISVPLIRENRVRASVYVNQSTPRCWTEAEITLVEEVANRTWDAVERIRAEIQLRLAKQTLETQVAERTRQLQDSQARQRVIFENSFSLQAVVAHDGTLLDANETALAVIGARPVDVLGKSFADAPWFTGTPGMPEHMRDAVEAARKGNGSRQEILVNLPVGGWRWLDFALRPIYGPAGAIEAIVAEAVETTERRAAEAALLQAQKLEAMGQLTGGVAHDFNNLLTPILGSLDMLHRRRVGNEREQRLIEGGLQSAERARVLVQRLLAFARKQPLQPQPVDVAVVINGMRELIASTSGPRIHVDVDIAPNMPAAIAEISQLEMALLNLAVNARDAMPNGGILTLSLQAEFVGAAHRLELAPGAYVKLRVADTGIGMDTATLQRAVEPFFSTKGIGKGTGLGLSMVHGLARQLGGTLGIISKPGLGTIVDLFLPVSERAPEEGQIADDFSMHPAAHSGVALLVDDEDLVRATTADMLAEMGYQVLQAASAAEALDLFGGHRIDLLVTDHLMPGMTGTDLAHAARKMQPGLPILVISGYAELEGVAADLPRLAKPFRSADLSQTLAGLEPVAL